MYVMDKIKSETINKIEPINSNRLGLVWKKDILNIDKKTKHASNMPYKIDGMKNFLKSIFITFIEIKNMKDIRIMAPKIENIRYIH